jgi:hypothetical protein
VLLSERRMGARGDQRSGPPGRSCEEKQQKESDGEADTIFESGNLGEREVFLILYGCG